MSDLGFTVIEVFRALRLRPTPGRTWAAGNRLRDVYVAVEGHLPPKRLGPKTDGSGGTHCFAYYPGWLWPDAVVIIEALASEPEPQLAFDFAEREWVLA
jgi:hypothetical protein